ncbi:SdpI family protein [Hymenobacter sp. 15J16-1T3B]|uniref:SdpI family protein n=1 Tax=Hymenobacter sp. 15J16-1T3B TaxID=2886941 RepID=UPI001D0F8FD0|nr:SdpI family protein [Hymenobacter sp. 15J16-1T3B]MCC3158872.1 SdpI family protein [Hymenobacter sp. 15J16-1T3B]
MDKEAVATGIALVVVCGLALLMAWVTKYRPPKHINWLYGYRTARSMRTPATWQEANSYFARYFWRLSWALLVLAVVAFLLIGGTHALQIVLACWVLGIAVGLVSTERRLQRLFDNKGQPKAPEGPMAAD